MHHARIFELLIFTLSLRGFVKIFIHSIGDPMNDFDFTAILSKYVSLINYFRTKKWLDPLMAWGTINEKLGYWKLFFCEICINFWLSIILFAYICTSIKEYIIILGINFLTIKIIK